MHHDVTFNFGFGKVCSPTIFETYFSYDKGIWIAATDYYNVLLHNCAIFIDSYSPIDKVYSFIIFSLLINTVILLLNCFFLILYLHIHFLYLNIIWTFI